MKTKLFFIFFLAFLSSAVVLFGCGGGVSEQAVDLNGDGVIGADDVDTDGDGIIDTDTNGDGVVDASDTPSSEDTTAPTNVTLPVNPVAGLTATNSNNLTFTLTSDDVNATYEKDVDGGGYTACSGSTCTMTALTDGDHTISFRAKDPSGNTSTVTSVSITVDTAAPTAPTVTITTAPFLAGTTIYDNTAAIQGTFTSDAGTTTQCKLDTTTTYADCLSSSTWGIPAGTCSASDTHAYTVKSADAAGNESTGSSVTFSCVCPTCA